MSVPSGDIRQDQGVEEYPDKYDEMAAKLGEVARLNALVSNAGEAAAAAETARQAAEVSASRAFRHAHDLELQLSQARVSSYDLFWDNLPGSNSSPERQDEAVVQCFHIIAETVPSTGRNRVNAYHDLPPDAIQDYLRFKSLRDHAEVLIVGPMLPASPGMEWGDLIISDKNPELVKSGPLPVETLQIRLTDIREGHQAHNKRFGLFYARGLDENIIVGRDAIKRYIKAAEYEPQGLDDAVRFKRSIVQLELQGDCDTALLAANSRIDAEAADMLGLHEDSTAVVFHGATDAIVERDFRLLATVMREFAFSDNAATIISKIAELVAKDAPHADSLIKFVALAAQGSRSTKEAVSIDSLYALKRSLVKRHKDLQRRLQRRSER